MSLGWRIRMPAGAALVVLGVASLSGCGAVSSGFSAGLGVSGASPTPATSAVAPTKTSTAAPTSPAKAATAKASHAVKVSEAVSTASKASGCALKSKGEVYIRSIAPRVKWSALKAGDVVDAQCISIVDMPWQKEKGYCTQIAYVKDNPTYNVEAVPAKPLKKVFLQMGGSC